MLQTEKENVLQNYMRKICLKNKKHIIPLLKTISNTLKSIIFISVLEISLSEENMIKQHFIAFKIKYH